MTRLVSHQRRAERRGTRLEILALVSSLYRKISLFAVVSIMLMPVAMNRRKSRKDCSIQGVSNKDTTGGFCELSQEKWSVLHKSYSENDSGWRAIQTSAESCLQVISSGDVVKRVEEELSVVSMILVKELTS